jgi:hypothetical protein
MMTPEYRKASVKLLMQWSRLAHDNPQKFLRHLAETTDEGLSDLIHETGLSNHHDLPPQSFIRAIADFEAGRIIDLQKALTEPYPDDPKAA